MRHKTGGDNPLTFSIWNSNLLSARHSVWLRRKNRTGRGSLSGPFLVSGSPNGWSQMGSGSSSVCAVARQYLGDTANRNKIRVSTVLFLKAEEPKMSKRFAGQVVLVAGGTGDWTGSQR